MSVSGEIGEALQFGHWKLPSGTSLSRMHESQKDSWQHGMITASFKYPLQSGH